VVEAEDMAEFVEGFLVDALEVEGGLVAQPVEGGSEASSRPTNPSYPLRCCDEVLFNFPQILKAMLIAQSPGRSWSWMKKVLDDI